MMALPRVNIRVPRPIRPSRLRLLANLLASTVLVPVYWAFAWVRGVPGLRFRGNCFVLGMKLLVVPEARFNRRHALRLMLMPMDSTRYFEFDFAEREMSRVPATRYLDVSSPRMVPVMFTMQRSEIEADLINPDSKDLVETREVVNATGLAGRCSLHCCKIADAALAPESFDLLTCVSVLEHIPEDTEALRKMWALLKPGGVLVLTLPCKAQACDQYIDHDEYGLLPHDGDGYVFWQRFYDEKQLQDRVYRVLGRPSRVSVYGENKAGSFASNAEMKRRLGEGYPFWREPYMMAVEYSLFTDVSQLPGEGVIGMTFIKK